jgi:hypothetical protein
MAKFRGSSFGGCIHSHLACLRGLDEADPPAHLKAIFERGHAAEAWAKDKLASQGVKWIEAGCGLAGQKDQELSIWGDDPASDRVILISVTPDGLAADKSDPENTYINAEFKSFSKTSYKEWLRDGFAGNERYGWQFAAEMHGYQRKYRGKKIKGILVPIIAENNKEWSEGSDEPRWFFELGEFTVCDEAPYTEEQCLQRCRDILALYDAGEWVECKGKYACRYPHLAALVADVEAEAIISRYEESVKNWVAATKELETLIAGVDIVGSRRIYRSQVQMVGIQ